MPGCYAQIQFPATLLFFFSPKGPVLGMRASQVAQVVKKPAANAGDVRDVGSIPGLARSSGGGHGNPVQYSRLKNPIDRGASWATDHGVAESDTTKVT